MSWASKRKASYFFIFIVVAAILVGIPLYNLLHVDPTCFDGQQNQQEDGVDCGGPCVKLCKPLELLPVVLWQQAFKVTEGVYSLAAYVENPNLNGEAFNVPYTFTVYGQGSIVLATRSGKSYIPYGKNFLVFESNVRLGTTSPARVDFSFDPNFIWQVAKKKPDLKVTNITITNNPPAPSVSADINNPSLKELDATEVDAIVYNAAGNAFAVSRTFVDQIGPQSTEHVVFTWPLLFSQDAARAELIPIVH